MRLRLNGIFKDNMVFQWGAEIRVFGSSSTPCFVCVQLMKDNELVVETQVQTDENNMFIAGLDPVDEPGGPYTIIVLSFVEGEKEWVTESVMSDCFAGEVWLAAGQSNMEYPLIRSAYSSYTIEQLPTTGIHFYNVPAAGFIDDAQIAAEDESKWVIIDKDTCKDMSAVAFYFARRLESRIDCRIGIIGCYLGDSSISCWLSEERLASTADGCKIKSAFDLEASVFNDEDFDLLQKEFDDEFSSYISKVDELLKEDPYLTYLAVDEIVGPMLNHPPIGYRALRHPGSLFECMVMRVAPFTLRGVIFYQGESDCDQNASCYGKVFASLIAEWREVFYDLDLPFIFCQLPMYISKERKFMNYDDYSWAKLREQQQTVAAEVHDTYMAVLADCGEFDNIHPADKKIPGERIAAMALKYIYGCKGVAARAPYIIDARRGDGVEVSFAGDFMMLNLYTGFDSDDTGFEVAGEDGEFFRAAASVDFDGKTVILSCPYVEYPVKVRYAYFSYGPTPLYAENGLAAAPFCVNVEKNLGGS